MPRIVSPSNVDTEIKTQLSSLVWNPVAMAICGSSHFLENMRLLLGESFSDIRAFQYAWLNEVVADDTPVPSLLFHGSAKGIAHNLQWYTDSQLRRDKDTSTTELKDEARRVFKLKAREALDMMRDVEYTWNDIPSDAKVANRNPQDTSGAILLATLNAIDCERLSLQLQSLFVLVIAHISLPQARVNKMLKAWGPKTPWRSKTPAPELRRGELFVLQLVTQLTTHDLAQVLAWLPSRFGSHIPYRCFDTLCTALKQGGAAELMALPAPSIDVDVDPPDNDDTPQVEVTSSISPGALNLKGLSTTQCPSCEREHVKSNFRKPKCDAMLCPCGTAFCFACGVVISQEAYMRKGHGEHFTTRENHDDWKGLSRLGWCYLRWALDQGDGGSGNGGGSDGDDGGSDKGGGDKGGTEGSDSSNSDKGDAADDEDEVCVMEVLTGGEDGPMLRRSSRTRNKPRTVYTSYSSSTTSKSKRGRKRRSKKVGGRSKSKRKKEGLTYDEVMAFLRDKYPDKYEDIVDLTTENKTAAIVSSMPPSKDSRTILEAVRSGEREDLITDLKWDVPCSGCGMLLVDSDRKYDLVKLNRMLRKQNVSVCVLRSRSQHDNISAEHGSGTAIDDFARMGRFKEVYETEWVDVRAGDYKRPVLSSYIDDMSAPPEWDDVMAKMSAADTDLLELSPSNWDLETFVPYERFKAWWSKETDKWAETPTWPLLSRVSTALRVYAEEDLGAVVAEFMDNSESLDSNIMDLTFGVLIGGLGSPPHIDTITDVPRGASEMREISDYRIHTSMAMGVVIQGVKYFWAIRPKGKPIQDYLSWCRVNPPPELTAKQRDVRRMLLDGHMPYPFQGMWSMGWASERQWDSMPRAGICNHLHPVYGGDGYIVMDGCMHSVINNRRLQPVAVAFDDTWLGHGSYLEDWLRANLSVGDMKRRDEQLMREGRAALKAVNKAAKEAAREAKKAAEEAAKKAAEEAEEGAEDAIGEASEEVDEDAEEESGEEIDEDSEEEEEEENEELEIEEDAREDAEEEVSGGGVRARVTGGFNA